MQLKLKQISCAVFVALVAGCSAVTMPQDTREEIDKTHQSVEEQKNFIDESPFVFEFDRAYVKQLSERETSMPDWFNQPIGQVLTKNFMDAIKELFLKMPVNLEFRDGIDNKQSISLMDKEMTFGQALDYAAAITGFSYQVVDGSVVWSKYVTEIFEIKQLPGNETYLLGSNQQSGDSNQSSGGQSEDRKGLFMQNDRQDASQQGQLDTLEETKQAVDAILGCKKESGEGTSDNNEALAGQNTLVCTDGASSKILRSVSSIMVRALPSQLTNVKQFIESQNDKLTRQVRIDIQLIEVQYQDQAQNGIDLNAVDNAFRNWGALKINSNAGDGIIGGLDKAGVFEIEYIRQGTDVSNMLIKALSAQGAVSSSTYPQVVTINNRVAKIGTVERQDYISSRELQQTANVGAASAIKQSTVETGYTLNVLPTILNDEVIVKLTTSNSSLLGIETKGEEGQQVESPNINDKFFNSTLKLQHGKPLILAGLSDNNSQTKNSLGMAGFANSASKKRSETMLLIQAHIF